ncbi:MAG: protein kinase [Acidobacteriota bacterium]
MFGKYLMGPLIGEGGMGRVYEAFDKTLNRFVALKFLRGDNPSLTVRLVQEARAQAQVDHDSVCKVYEVGEIEGKPFIAVQYIPGRTLDQVSPEMTLEQKVRVMREVAEGVHAAHRIGLIHRDLKPANVMVEKTAEGHWKPYVMDFGLAREVATPGLTVTGVVMGTVGYMAPEQARGRVHELDRRTDVYGLGATFYEILTGRPPVAGSTSIDAILALLETDPEPVRKLNPRVPADIETVVMKCLEKEPQRRYDSARALADDLQRYLDGEPIEARRASYSYRILKKAGRHKAVTAVVAVSFTVVLALAAVAWSAWRTAKVRSRVAQQLGQAIERMDSIMRVAHTIPLHDTRPEQAAVRAQIRDIEGRMKEAGSAADWPGHYAIGRGFMALQETEAAKTHLEAAWNSGYREPQVAYALGLVLGAIYQRELDEADRIPNKPQRDARRKKLDTLYRAPALEMLRNGRGYESGSVEYGEALIAFYEKRYPEALRLADRALLRAPWMYEAIILRGEVYCAEGIDAANRGDYRTAVQSWEEAARVHQDATRIGESDPAAYEAICDVWTRLMYFEIYQHGGSARPYFDWAVAAAESALRAEPDRATTCTKLSYVYYLWSEYQIRHGQDPSASYDRAAEAAQTAVRRRPDDSTGWLHLGNIQRARAVYLMRLGQDPAEALGVAVHNLTEATRRPPPSAFAHHYLGWAHTILGTGDMAQGRDPTPEYQEAIREYRDAIRIDQVFAVTNSGNNIGETLNYLSQYRMAHGIDPTASLDEAQRMLEGILSANPDHLYARLNLIDTLRLRAEYLWRTGGDPTRALDQADAHSETVLKVNASDPDVRLIVAQPATLRGRVLLAGKAGSQALAQVLATARAHLDQALALNPNFARALREMAVLEMLEAQMRANAGQAAEPGFRRAAGELDRAATLNPSDAETYARSAELCRVWAEWRGRRGLSVREEIQRGLAAAGRAVSINPTLADALATEGVLHLLSARLERDPARRMQSVQTGRAAVERAARIDPLLGRELRDELGDAAESLITAAR